MKSVFVRLRNIVCATCERPSNSTGFGKTGWRGLNDLRFTICDLRGPLFVPTVNRSGHMLVCFALKEEAAPFRKIAADRPDISILVTGIGWKNADRAVSEFLASITPSHILTCGCAGGLDPNLAVGAVLFETGDAGLRETLTGAGASPGRFVCATRIATTAQEKQALRLTTAADAVEMESGAI